MGSVQNKSTGFTSLSGLLSPQYEAQPPPHLRDPGSLPRASLPSPGGGGEGQEISSGGDGVHHPGLVQLQQPLQSQAEGGRQVQGAGRGWEQVMETDPRNRSHWKQF